MTPNFASSARAVLDPPSADERPRVIHGVDVHKIYRNGGLETHALRGVNVAIHRGEFLSIMGASGSGKSTLFNMLGALQKPTSGRVYIDQVSIAELLRE